VRRSEGDSSAFTDMTTPYRDPVHVHRVENAIAALRR